MDGVSSSSQDYGEEEASSGGGGCWQAGCWQCHAGCSGCWERTIPCDVLGDERGRGACIGKLGDGGEGEG